MIQFDVHIIHVSTFAPAAVIMPQLRIFAGEHVSLPTTSFDLAQSKRNREILE